MSRTVVFLVNNSFVADSRVWKMAHSLKQDGADVTIVARDGEGLASREDRDGFTILRVAPPERSRHVPGLPRTEGPTVGTGRDTRASALLRETVGRVLQGTRYLLHARRWAAKLNGVVPNADVWQAEGLVTLPVALELRRRRGGVVVYDSRDIHVEQGRLARLPRFWRAMLRRRERAWAASADAVVTVSEPYADVLEQALGRRPMVIWNGPVESTAAAGERSFHERLRLPPGTPVVLYLGQLIADRGIPELCQAMADVSTAVLVVAGYGDKYEQYRSLASGLPHADRIHFLPSIAPSEIPLWTAAADVAAIPVQARTLNLKLNTPTKLFDAMGAGVPVVVSDIPGMAAIVRRTGCGVVCDPFSPADIARALRAIIEAPPDRRAAFRRAAREGATEFAWELQAERLSRLHDELLAGR